MTQIEKDDGVFWLGKVYEKMTAGICCSGHWLAEVRSIAEVKSEWEKMGDYVAALVNRPNQDPNDLPDDQAAIWSLSLLLERACISGLHATPTTRPFSWIQAFLRLKNA